MRRLSVVLTVLLVAALVACSDSSSTSTGTSASRASASSSVASASGTQPDGATLTLDPAKDYGDRYADGILPVGDNHYTTDAAKQGYVFLCHTGGPGGG